MGKGVPMWMLRLLAFLVGGLAAVATAADMASIYVTAPHGSLIIVGGGDTPKSVQERFISLAGGPGKARVAVFPMASTKFDEEADEVMADLRSLGGEVNLLNIGREAAQSEEMSRQLEAYTGYWFLGGDQSRLASTLVGTRALETIERRYREGAVVGGTSAGAAVMSNVMLTGKWRNPRNPEEEEMQNIARGMLEISKGFGFFKGAIVDQHFMRRARYNRLLSAVLDHPQLIGVGIDEETALLVRPDGLWEVLGEHYVKIFDARRAHIIEDGDSMAKASNITMHVLPGGSTFNAKKRSVTFGGG